MTNNPAAASPIGNILPLGGPAALVPHRSCDTEPVLEDDDPGWPLVGLVPFAGPFIARRRRRAGTADGLVTIRQMFLAFCLAIALFGYVLAFLDRGDTERPSLAVAVLVVGAASVLVGRFVEKPLNCGDEGKLKASYLNRFFIRIAFSEAAALLGFAAFFVTGERWVYYLAAVITYVGFARAAPSRGHLRRDQDILRERGCYLQLVPALRTPPPRRGRGA